MAVWLTQMAIVFGLNLLATYMYIRFTWPALGVRRWQADADPVMERRVNHGLLVNWSVGLTAILLLSFALTRLPLPAWVGASLGASLFAWMTVAIATGAWMEIVRGHEGAP